MQTSINLFFPGFVNRMGTTTHKPFVKDVQRLREIMNIWVYIYTHIYLFIDIYIHIYTHIYDIYIHIYEYIYLYVNICIYTQCVYICYIYIIYSKSFMVQQKQLKQLTPRFMQESCKNISETLKHCRTSFMKKVTSLEKTYQLSSLYKSIITVYGKFIPALYK